MSNQKPQIIQQGAEAVIILVEQKEGSAVGNHGVLRLIIKDRIKKNYRIENIDVRLRKQRTKAEKKLLKKASKLINSPKPLENDDIDKIIMPNIEGKKLSEHLDKLPDKLAKETCKEIGKSIATLHDNSIIHGDLTTSNIILDKENKVWFIDFGLGFHSERFEDKAVDLHLIKQALETKHFKKYQEYWKAIEKGYQSSKNYSKTLEQLKKVESRGRYKDKY